MVHDGCVCGDQFRFEATDLITGRVKTLLHPIAADWESPMSAPGQGSMTVAARDLRAADIWPGKTGIYISKVNPDSSRTGYFGGVVEKFSGSAGSTVSIGYYGIDGYLNHRVLADESGGLTYSVNNRMQTLIAQDLVALGTQNNGIPLTAEAEPSDQFRDRTWNSWEYKNIGEAIDQLTKVINGVQYDIVHKFELGAWSSVMRFKDDVGVNRGVVLKSDREAHAYSLDVDGKDQATFVIAVGEGEEVDQKISIARDDETDLYPRFDAVPAWKDVSRQSTLNSHAIGYVVDHRDPATTISMEIAGLDNPAPEFLGNGDYVEADIDYGIVTYRGGARVLGQAWRVAVDEPVIRSIALQTTSRPIDSVFSQTPTDKCPEC